jgi:hypothetical protein
MLSKSDFQGESIKALFHLQYMQCTIAHAQHFFTPDSRTLPLAMLEIRIEHSFISHIFLQRSLFDIMPSAVGLSSCEVRFLYLRMFECKT